MKLNKIRQGMFFYFNGPIAWSLLVTEGYFCEEIIGIVIVRCRAPRRDKETAFAFAGYQGMLSLMPPLDTIFAH